MTIYGMMHVKSIYLRDSILAFMDTCKYPHIIQDFLDYNYWLKQPSFEKFRNMLQIDCQINDNKDVLVEIKNTELYSYQQIGGLIDTTGNKNYRSVFYWEAAKKLQE